MLKVLEQEIANDKTSGESDSKQKARNLDKPTLMEKIKEKKLET